MASRLLSVRRSWRGYALAAATSVFVFSGWSSAPQPGAVTQSVRCSTQVAAGKVLPAVRPVTLAVPGSPTAVGGDARRPVGVRLADER
jgi:hypothetical protein